MRGTTPRHFGGVFCDWLEGESGLDKEKELTNSIYLWSKAPINVKNSVSRYRNETEMVFSGIYGP